MNNTITVKNRENVKRILPVVSIIVLVALVISAVSFLAVYSTRFETVASKASESTAILVNERVIVEDIEKHYIEKGLEVEYKGHAETTTHWPMDGGSNESLV